MKRFVAAAALLTVGASGASAGGVDRSGQSIALIFEPGNYIEFAYGNVRPDVSGTQLLPLGPFGAPGADSGDMTGDYESFSLGVKIARDDRLVLAFILDQPVGAKGLKVFGFGPQDRLCLCRVDRDTRQFRRLHGAALQDQREFQRPGWRANQLDVGRSGAVQRLYAGCGT